MSWFMSEESEAKLIKAFAGWASSPTWKLGPPAVADLHRYVKFLEKENAELRAKVNGLLEDLPSKRPLQPKKFKRRSY